MPSPDLLAAFVLAVTVLMLIPGPNVALIVANSVAHGVSAGLVTVAGTASAMLLQLGVVALGMTGLLFTLGSWFEWVRWAGAIYLVYLGVMQWRAPPVDLTRARPEKRSWQAIGTRAFFVSLSNPKTLLFLGAFLPQFVARDRPLGPQIATLAVVFLLLALAIDSLWAVAAGRARRLLATRGRLRNRLSGGMLMGAGLVLAAARRR